MEYGAGGNPAPPAPSATTGSHHGDRGRDTPRRKRRRPRAEAGRHCQRQRQSAAAHQQQQHRTSFRSSRRGKRSKEVASWFRTTRAKDGTLDLSETRPSCSYANFSTATHQPPPTTSPLPLLAALPCTSHSPSTPPTPTHLSNPSTKQPHTREGEQPSHASHATLSRAAACCVFIGPPIIPSGKSSGRMMMRATNSQTTVCGPLFLLQGTSDYRLLGRCVSLQSLPRLCSKCQSK